MKKETRNNIAIYCAVALLIFGMVLAVAGFIVPPTGEIHGSVLWLIAQCFIFAGSVLGVTTYATAKISEVNAIVARAHGVNKPPTSVSEYENE